MQKILCLLMACVCFLGSTAGAYTKSSSNSTVSPEIMATLERFAELQQTYGKIPASPVSENITTDGKEMHYSPFEGLEISGSLANAADETPTYTLSMPDNMAFDASALQAILQTFLMAVEPSLTFVVADELLYELLGIAATYDGTLEDDQGIGVYYGRWDFELAVMGGGGSRLKAFPSTKDREEPNGTSLARLEGVYLRFLSHASDAGFKLNDDITYEYKLADPNGMDHYRTLADGLAWQETFDGGVFFGRLLQVDRDSSFEAEFEDLFLYFLLSHSPTLKLDEVDEIYAYLNRNMSPTDDYQYAEVPFANGAKLMYFVDDAQRTVAIVESRLPTQEEDARIDIRNMDTAYQRFRNLCKEEQIPLMEDAPPEFVDDMWHVQHPIAGVEWGYGIDLNFTVYIYILADVASLTKQESYELVKLTVRAADAGCSEEEAEALLRAMLESAKEEDGWLVSEAEADGIKHRLTETASGYTLAVTILDPVRGNQDK